MLDHVVLYCYITLHCIMYCYIISFDIIIHDIVKFYIALHCMVLYSHCPGVESSLFCGCAFAFDAFQLSFYCAGQATNFSGAGRLQRTTYATTYGSRLWHSCGAPSPHPAHKYVAQIAKFLL